MFRAPGPAVKSTATTYARASGPGSSDTPTNEFFADIAHTWVGRYATRASFQERLRSVAQVAGPILARSEKPAVLDFGGGPGIFSLLCSGQASLVINLDPSAEMIRAGIDNREKMAMVVSRIAPVSFSPIRHVVGTLDVFSAGANSRFDLILAIAVLEYIDEPQKVVDRLGRMLTPGGSLLLTVPRERSGFRQAERMFEPVADRWRTDRAPSRMKERSYRTLLPHRDSVPWRPSDGPGSLHIDLWRPLALGSRGLRAHVRPNDIVVLRRPTDS